MSLFQVVADQVYIYSCFKYSSNILIGNLVVDRL